MVEIVKAISFNARIVVMDEPTSSLSLPEVARLFEIVRRLKESGVGIIYISHRLDEIFTISDRVTVLRGRVVLSNSVGFNLTLAAVRLLGRGPLINSRKKKQMIERLIRQLNIKTNSPWAIVSSLSGGNQQKVVVAKWLATKPKF